MSPELRIFWTLNENLDAEFTAKVMKVRGRVLAEKEQHSEEARKAFERAKGASKEAMRRKNAELEAAPTDEASASAEQVSGSGPRCSTEGVSASGAGVPGAGVPDEVHTRRTPEHSSESLCRKFNCRPREALEQNYQPQNQPEERIVKLQEKEKLNAELHVKLLEEKEKLTVREQDNSMLEHRVEVLSDEVERTRMLQLERVLTCVSEASKDKNAPQRFAGEDNSQILTETQQEFKMDLPTDHEITDVTENPSNMWKSLQEYGNTEFHDAFIATQEEYQKIRSSGDTLGGEVAKLEHPKNKRQSEFEEESVEFSTEVADMWSATMDDMDITSTTCDDVDEKFDIDDKNWDHYWNTVDVVADEILPAIVPGRDKECDVTASEQTRKKTTWLMLGRVMLGVLEEVYKHISWWYELCRDEKCECCSRQRIW